MFMYIICCWCWYIGLYIIGKGGGGGGNIRKPGGTNVKGVMPRGYSLVL